VGAQIRGHRRLDLSLRWRVALLTLKHGGVGVNYRQHRRRQLRTARRKRPLTQLRANQRLHLLGCQCLWRRNGVDLHRSAAVHSPAADNRAATSPPWLHSIKIGSANELAWPTRRPLVFVLRLATAMPNQVAPSTVTMPSERKTPNRPGRGAPVLSHYFGGGAGVVGVARGVAGGTRGPVQPSLT